MRHRLDKLYCFRKCILRPVMPTETGMHHKRVVGKVLEPFPQIERTAKSSDIRISGYPDIRTSGYPDIRESGYPDLRISGYLDFRISGYPAIQISGILEFRISGFSEIRIFRYPDFRTSGFHESGSAKLILCTGTM